MLPIGGNLSPHSFSFFTPPPFCLPSKGRLRRSIYPSPPPSQPFHRLPQALITRKSPSLVMSVLLPVLRGLVDVAPGLFFQVHAAGREGGRNGRVKYAGFGRKDKASFFTMESEQLWNGTTTFPLLPPFLPPFLPRFLTDASLSAGSPQTGPSYHSVARI